MITLLIRANTRLKYFLFYCFNQMQSHMQNKCNECVLFNSFNFSPLFLSLWSTCQTILNALRLNFELDKVRTVLIDFHGKMCSLIKYSNVHFRMILFFHFDFSGQSFFSCVCVRELSKHFDMTLMGFCVERN